MPESFVFDDMTVAPGRRTLSLGFEWPTKDHPSRGPVYLVATPDPRGPVEIKLVIEDFACCRHPHGPVFYSCWISNLGTQSTGAKVMGVNFPEFQGDWVS
jgi:hypothetical protein